MFLEQFFLESLGHASYLVGSEETGEALVLDPQRRVDDYFSVARAQGMRIRYGIDTHGHNDYLSGLTELTARQPIIVLGSAEATLGYQHRPVRDGETIEMGEVGIEVLHTPGHTPEHISLLVYDRSAGDEPTMLLSGGALLVGDLARPDLLGSRDDAEQAAKRFCKTIQTKILTLPDHVAVFPTHVAGSLCGGNIGSRLSTTVGYERRTNAVLSRIDSVEGFVAECIRLDNLPAVPPYWKRMRGHNLAGVPLLGGTGEPPRPCHRTSSPRPRPTVLSCSIRVPPRPSAPPTSPARSTSASAPPSPPGPAPCFRRRPGPPSSSDPTISGRRAGSCCASGTTCRPAGWPAGCSRGGPRPEPSGPSPGHGARTRGPPRAGDGLAVLDVRRQPSGPPGTSPAPPSSPEANCPSRLEDAPAAPVIATVCGSGYRSSVAAGVLAAAGRTVVNVLGGMTAWNNAGYPTHRPAEGESDARRGWLLVAAQFGLLAVLVLGPSGKVPGIMQWE